MLSNIIKYANGYSFLLSCPILALEYTNKGMLILTTCVHTPHSIRITTKIEK